MDTLISGTWAWAPASIHESTFVWNFTWDPRQTSPNFSEGGWGRGEGICGNQTKSADGFSYFCFVFCLTTLIFLARFARRFLLCILPKYHNVTARFTRRFLLCIWPKYLIFFRRASRADFLLKSSGSQGFSPKTQCLPLIPPRLTCRSGSFTFTFPSWLVAQAQAEPVQIRLRKVVVSMDLPEARVKIPPKSGGEHGHLWFRLGLPPSPPPPVGRPSRHPWGP